MVIIGWTHMAKILIDFICFQISRSNPHAMLSNLLLRILGNNYLLFLTCMDMLTKKVAFCLEIPSIILDFKLRVFCLLNIYHLSVIMLSLNPVTSARNRCHLRIKIKIIRRRDVHGLSSINGLILPTVIHSKQVSSRT